MTHRSSLAGVPAIAGVDLDFRPTSYWDATDPVSAVLQNIKGQRRREMAKDFLLGRAPAELGPIVSSLLQDEVDDEERGSLGRIHPSFMGGEYLPGYLPGEVEIARIVLQSVTMDVYSIRARRPRQGGRILYRIEDEYESEWTVPRRSSARPLTLRQLVHLIDGSGWTLQYSNGFPLIEDHISFLLFDGDRDAESAAAFVSVESTVYPEIERYYQRRVLAWARAQLAERGEERE